jgi:hypothetical protein
MFHIDDVFLDISEICDATNTEIEIYEKNNQVNLSNFWCVDCSSKTLKEIESRLIMSKEKTYWYEKNQ